MARLNSRSKFPQPFVKWAGGKSQIISEISSLLPRQFNRYFEPFLGGGAVFFNLQPRDATISDANFELINAYRVIGEELESLLKILTNLQRQRISRTLYNKVRNLDPEKLPPHKRAARFIFLNKTCYNGLYRVNKNGKFNVPFGKYRRMPTLYEEENLLEIQKMLENTKLMCANYEVPLHYAAAGDLVYLDPPYSSNPKMPGFTSYTKESFSEADQGRLARKFKELHRRGCLVMLSNSNTKLVHELYSQYSETTFKVTAGRMINCVGSERTGYQELLILNYPPLVTTLAPWMQQTS